jgi:hypothetical protein
MSVTDASVVADDEAADVSFPGAGSFVERLVERLHTEYGEDPRAIRRHVAAVLENFAGARVQAFVPILVEKQVRQMYRRRNGLTALHG